MGIGPASKIGEFVNKASKCVFDEIEANGVSKESADLMNFMMSDQWIDIAEYGTKQEFTDYLGDAVDPLTSKLMDAYGPDIIGSMPTEMHQWIRDSTILWIKNQGAGSSTTELEILNDKANLNNRSSVKEVKAYYESKILKVTQTIVDLTQENKQYKNEILALEKKNDKYMD